MQRRVEEEARRRHEREEHRKQMEEEEARRVQAYEQAWAGIARIQRDIEGGRPHTAEFAMHQPGVEGIGRIVREAVTDPSLPAHWEFDLDAWDEVWGPSWRAYYSYFEHTANSNDRAMGRPEGETWRELVHGPEDGPRAEEVADPAPSPPDARVGVGGPVTSRQGPLAGRPRTRTSGRDAGTGPLVSTAPVWHEEDLMPLVRRVIGGLAPSWHALVEGDEVGARRDVAAQLRECIDVWGWYAEQAVERVTYELRRHGSDDE
jgi:hypothetical protein